jgi:hypothetical protein
MKGMKRITVLFVCQFLLFTSLAFAHCDEIFEKLKKDTQHLKDLPGLIVNGYHTKGETLPCKQHIARGAMGYHLRKDWKMDEVFDPTEPEEALVDTNGNLVAMEYVVYGDKAAVEMMKYFNIAYSDGPGEGDVKATGAPSFEHKGEGKYAFHVWAWAKNPEGPFMNFNPEVSCEKAKCREVVQEDGSKKLEGECSQLVR